MEVFLRIVQTIAFQITGDDSSKCNSHVTQPCFITSPVDAANSTYVCLYRITVNNSIINIGYKEKIVTGPSISSSHFIIGPAKEFGFTDGHVISLNVVRSHNLMVSLLFDRLHVWPLITWRTAVNCFYIKTWIFPPRNLLPLVSEKWSCNKIVWNGGR